MQSKGQTAAKVIGVILVLALLAGIVAVIYRFTNGFNEDFKTFYVEHDGKQPGVRQRPTRRIHPHAALAHPNHARAVLPYRCHGLVGDARSGAQHQDPQRCDRYSNCPLVISNRDGVLRLIDNASLEVDKRDALVGANQVGQNGRYDAWRRPALRAHILTQAENVVTRHRQTPESERWS